MTLSLHQKDSEGWCLPVRCRFTDGSPADRASPSRRRRPREGSARPTPPRQDTRHGDGDRLHTTSSGLNRRHAPEHSCWSRQVWPFPEAPCSGALQHPAHKPPSLGMAGTSWRKMGRSYSTRSLGWTDAMMFTAIRSSFLWGACYIYLTN